MSPFLHRCLLITIFVAVQSSYFSTILPHYFSIAESLSQILSHFSFRICQSPFLCGTFLWPFLLHHLLCGSFVSISGRPSIKFHIFVSVSSSILSHRPFFSTGFLRTVFVAASLALNFRRFFFSMLLCRYLLVVLSSPLPFRHVTAPSSLLMTFSFSRPFTVAIFPRPFLY